VLAVGTGNAIVNNVHHRSACSVVQPCFWNNVYALNCNRGSNTYVRLQKDAAILKMTLDDRLRTLSLAPITSQSTFKSIHGVNRATGMLYELFYTFLISLEFTGIQPHRTRVVFDFFSWFVVLQVQALSHETLGSCVRQGACTQFFKMLPKTGSSMAR